MTSMENDKTIKKSYWSVTPAEVRYCKALGGGDPKHLYGEISALCNERGYCWASNQYFAELYDVDERSVRRWVSLLEKHGFIYTVIKGKSRKIFLTKSHPMSPEEHDERSDIASEEEDEKDDKPSQKKTKKAKYSDQDLFLAELLYSKVIYNFPALENKKVTIAEWAEDVRRLREIDKATAEQIQFMIVWIQGGDYSQPGRPAKSYAPHDFWSRNILSARKLRKQWFDNLVPQLQQTMKKQLGKKETKTVRL